jgi:hypothetical protein
MAGYAKWYLVERARLRSHAINNLQVEIGVVNFWIRLIHLQVQSVDESSFWILLEGFGFVFTGW